MTTKVRQLVQLWEAKKKDCIHPGPGIFYQLTEHQAAGYVLWIYGGCPEAAITTIGLMLEGCTADRYPFWYNVNIILKEASKHE